MIDKRLLALTNREMQIAELLPQGLTNEAIGREIGIAGRSVSWYLDWIYKKLDVHSRAEVAAIIAREQVRNDGMKQAPIEEGPLRAAPLGRFTIRTGWDRVGHTGMCLGSVWAGQWWAIVIWDGDEDPDLYKLSGLRINDGKTLSAREVSEIVGCPKKTVNNWLDQGYFPGAIKSSTAQGSPYAIPIEEVRDFVRRRRDRAKGDVDTWESALDGLDLFTL